MIFANKKKKWAIELAKFLEGRVNNDYDIVIGGDGTLLYYKDKIENPVILIGSNSSRRAHIKYKSNEEVLEKLESLYKKEYYELPLLEVEEHKAINDVVIHSSNYLVIKTISKSKYFEKEDEGDGVIISTSFGSLAYNKSVGGSEVSLSLEALSLSFISSIHRNIPIVFPLSDVEVKVYGKASLIIDGVEVKQNIEEVKISYKGKKIKYVKY